MLVRRSLALILCFAALALATTDEKVPRPSPDFAVGLTNGSLVQVSQYRGKVLVLAFILTYCNHCQFTAQVLSKLQTEYGPRGFQVVGSAIEDMPKLAVPDFIKKFQPAFPVGFNSRTAVLDYLHHPVMFRLMMPQLVVIDRKGVIRAQLSGDDTKFFESSAQEKNIRGLIEPLLKEGTVAAPRRQAVKRKAVKK
jgi:peroxiredoxin